MQSSLLSILVPWLLHIDWQAPLPQDTVFGPYFHSIPEAPSPGARPDKGYSPAFDTLYRLTAEYEHLFRNEFKAIYRTLCGSPQLDTIDVLVHSLVTLVCEALTYLRGGGGSEPAPPPSPPPRRRRTLFSLGGVRQGGNLFFTRCLCSQNAQNFMENSNVHGKHEKF